MISKLALQVAGYFSGKDIYSCEKIDIYKYGFELLISTAINGLCIFLISLILGIPLGAVLFCASFVPLRLAAGGYHAKHHWSCIITFNLIFIGFAMLNRLMSNEFALYYSLIAVAISSILLWAFAPVEAINKPLKPDQQVRQRKRSIILSSVNLAIAFMPFAIESLSVYSQVIALYCSGALAASLSLVVAMIANRSITATKST